MQTVEESVKENAKNLKIIKEELEDIKSKLYLYFSVFMKQSFYTSQLNELTSNQIMELGSKLDNISLLTREYSGKNAADYHNLRVKLIKDLGELAIVSKRSEVSKVIEQHLTNISKGRKLDSAHYALFSQGNIKAAINLLYSRLNELKEIDEIVKENSYEELVQKKFGNRWITGDPSTGFPGFIKKEVWGKIAEERAWFVHYVSYLTNSLQAENLYPELLQEESYENLLEIRNRLAEMNQYVQTTGRNHLQDGHNSVNKISHSNFSPTLEEIDAHTKIILEPFNAILAKDPDSRKNQLISLALQRKQTQEKTEVKNINNFFMKYKNLDIIYQAKRGVFKNIFTPQRGSRKNQVSELDAAIKTLLASCNNFPEVSSKDFAEKYVKYQEEKKSLQATLIKIERQFAQEESIKKYFQPSSLEALCKEMHEFLDDTLKQKTYEGRIRPSGKKPTND